MQAATAKSSEKLYDTLIATGLDDYQAQIAVHLNDEEWRMDNLYYIRDKWGTVIPFKRNVSQMQFWQEMWYSNVILKDRQRGFSTLVALFFLDRCFWNNQTQAGIIDIKIDEAKKKLDKVKLAYDELEKEMPWVTAMNPMTERAAEHVKFRNGSEIWVSTSHRGGTLQLLHISEFGAIAARAPQKAKEIKSGALNTIAEGNITIFESTAEGAKGDFFDICQKAKKLSDTGGRLTFLDNKFHFFAWWMDGQDNEMDPTGIVVSPEITKYLDELELELGVKLNDRKRAWYFKKSEQQTDDMHREFPSTPDEAFHAPVEGAYLAKIMVRKRKKGMICPVPHDPSAPVNTGWDFGLNDYMTIWFHQRVGLQERLIGYMQGTDDDVLHYWKKMNEDNPEYVWGAHFIPHDGGHRRIGTGTMEDSDPKTLQDIMTKAGMRNVVVVPRVSHNAIGIQEVKLWLPVAFIDEKNCDEGIIALENFRREWDDKLDLWKDSYRHDLSSHGYKGLETLVRGIDMYGLDLATEVATKVQPQVRNQRREPANWRTA